MGKARTIPLVRILTRARNRLDGPSPRHNEKVEHIADAGTAQVGVAEAHDRAIRVVVSRAPVPFLIKGVRTQLHHTERNCCSRITVTMSASADHNVHETRDILRSWLVDEHSRLQ